MIHPVDTILALVLLSILFSFGSSRLPGLIKVMAFQGVVVSSCPFSSAMRCPPAAWSSPS
jgi:hydrogenase-4 component E